MKLSVNEGYFRKTRTGPRRTAKQALDICCVGGFDTVDFGLCSADPAENPVLAADGAETARYLRDYCDTIGVAVDQTHAPYELQNLSAAQLREQLVRSVEISRILGAKTVVVHADTYYDKEYRFDFDTVLQTVYECYAPMVEAAEKADVRIAMETLFEDRAPQGKRARFTSLVEELTAIVGKFNTSAVGICWDFGHAGVVYGNGQFEKLRNVGDKVIATHVHDNMISRDLHMFPYSGQTDWETALRTLGEIGYTGSFTFELVYGCMPDELLADYARLLHKTGRFMVEEIEKYRP